MAEIRFFRLAIIAAKTVILNGWGGVWH